MGLKINKAYKLETHLHKLIIVHHITTQATYIADTYKCVEAQTAG